MRSLRLMFGIGILAGSASLAGCSGAAGFFSNQDGGAGAGGQGGAAGADAGNPDATGSAGHPGCDPTASPKNHPCAVNNQQGVFIDATNGSDDTGTGTEQKPFKTFAKGVAAASAAGKRLFACAGTYAESVKLTANNNGIEMYGGFDCSNWSYTGAKTEVKDATNGPALSMDTVATAHIEDIDFTSSDATTPGNSSVAASVKDSSKIDLVDVVLTAGKGAPGLDGVAFTKGATTGATGNAGADACAANPNPGGGAATTACGAAQSVGGKGGDGAVGGLSGGTGQPGTPSATGTGAGGFGQNGSSSWSCATIGVGQGGANGANGTPGAGATTLGTLDASGITGVAGTDGTAGKPGQGGGGGGGAQAPGGTNTLVCTVLGANVGASGGSGGGGGCGGQGGPGGGPGGSSIALISINSDIVLTGAKLVAADGGNGGNGASGQNGGNGGPGAQGGGGGAAANGCRGGDGGKGGNGGPGGGGTGGHSIAIAYTGSTPLVGTGTTMTEATTPAPGGLGGGSSATNKGTDGITKDLQSF